MENVSKLRGLDRYDLVSAIYDPFVEKCYLLIK